MESTDSSMSPPQPHLPPGFRFHPTDEELVVHYLKKKATSAPLPVAIIAEVDLYKFDPWELPAKATFGEQEWYFFSPRDRKYPNGARPNRAATSGYWKATGTDKPVMATGGNQKVGVKKALVFYGGKPPKGIKTNWIMHEYRLAENKANYRPPGCDFGNKKNSLRLDDWVLCRIYKKNNSHRTVDHHDRDLDSMDEMIGGIPPSMRISTDHHLQHHLSHTASISNSALLDQSHHQNDQNLYEVIISSNDMSSAHLPFLSPTSKDHHLATSQYSLPLKRPLPSWNGDYSDYAAVDHASPIKRLNMINGSDHHDMMNGGSSRATSNIATLLSQLPQNTTPLMHQQTTLGDLGDGLFRLPYQLQGMNWYS